MWNSLINLEHDIFGLKTMMHCVIGIVLFIIANITAAIVSKSLSNIITVNSIIIILNCCFNIIFFFLLISLYVRKGLKKSLSFFRINNTKPLKLFIFISIILPCCVIGFYYYFIDGTWSVNNAKIYEKIFFALSIGLSAGVCEEILFRGYIMKLVEIRWNKKIAVCVPSVLFALLHISGSMNILDILQLLLAGIAVGIMFSSVTYANDTVNNSMVVHGVWNFFILGIVGISGKENHAVLISYVIRSDSIWITGGTFGVESGLPAVIGYALVALLAIRLYRRRIPPVQFHY